MSTFQEIVDFKWFIGTSHLQIDPLATRPKKKDVLPFETDPKILKSTIGFREKILKHSKLKNISAQ